MLHAHSHIKVSCPCYGLILIPAGYVECEPPNNRLHKFVGKLQWKREEETESKDYSLDNDNILLRVGQPRMKSTLHCNFVVECLVMCKLHFGEVFFAFSPEPVSLPDAV